MRRAQKTVSHCYYYIFCKIHESFKVVLDQTTNLLRLGAPMD